MTPLDVSEAQQWRRCSLAGVAVLVLSVVGERVLNAEPTPASKRGGCQRTWNYEAPTRAFRFLNHFVTMPSR